MLCPPSRGLASACLPLSPHMCACLGWCVSLPEVLSLLVSHCLPLSPHMCACVGWCVRLPDVLSSLALADAPAFPRSCLPLSPSLPACVPALDAVSAFPGSCLRLSPIVRCVRLPEVLSLLVTRCFPLCVLRSPSRGLVSPYLRLWPIVSHMCACVGWWAHLPEVLPPLICHFFPHACLCWSTFPRSCFLLSPIFSPHVCLDGCLSLPLHRWCIRFPEVLPPLVSQCLPTCEFVLDACLSCLRTGVPVLDGVSVFPRFVSPSLRLCSIVSHMCACVRCCVRSCLPLSPTVFPHMCACVGWCVRLSPLVSLCFPHIVAHVSLRWKVCSPSRGLVSPLSPHIFTPPNPPPCPNASHCFHCPPLLSLSPHMLFFPSNAIWLSPSRLSIRTASCILQIPRINAVATSS